jgi:hypothetical protein
MMIARAGGKTTTRKRGWNDDYRRRAAGVAGLLLVASIL